MKLLDRYDYNRRDCKCDLECEECGNKEEGVRAYDDHNFWHNVIPQRKCKQCGKSTAEMGVELAEIVTKYAPYEVV